MKNKKSFILQLIFWFLFTMLIYTLISVRETNADRAWAETIPFVIYLATLSYLNSIILIPKLLAKKKYIWYSISILILFIFMPILYLKLNIAEYIIPRELGQKLRMRRHNRIFAPRHLMIQFFTSFVLFVSTVIRLMITSAQEEKNKIRAEKERLLIESKYLRAQMNPHFFLNALNNLQSINKLYPQHSEKYIGILSEMMRYVTYDCKKEFVIISKEINYIQNYIYFQKVKDDELAVEFTYEIENDKTKVEPMIFMPFLENAFKYGISDNQLHPIKVNVIQQGKLISFYCSNLIKHTVNKNFDESYSGIGIKNIQERLKVTYPNKHSLKIENKGKYFEVNLSLEI